MPDLTPDDLAYWGATEADEAVRPAPETRLIGETLFVKTEGRTLRFPVRVKGSDLAAFVEKVGADDLPLFAEIVGKYASEKDAAAFADLDLLDQTVVAVRFFAAFRDLAEATVGKS